MVRAFMPITVTMQVASEVAMGHENLVATAWPPGHLGGQLPVKNEGRAPIDVTDVGQLEHRTLATTPFGHFFGGHLATEWPSGHGTGHLSHATTFAFTFG